MTAPTHNTTEEVTEEEINLLQELERKATPQFWKVLYFKPPAEEAEYHISPIQNVVDGRINNEADANLIVKSRNLLPRLLRSYREMKASSKKWSNFENARDVNKYITGLEAQLAQKDAVIEKMRLALDFYGYWGFYFKGSVEKECPIMADAGKQARQCLDELKGGKEG